MLFLSRTVCLYYALAKINYLSVPQPFWVAGLAKGGGGKRGWFCIRGRYAHVRLSTAQASGVVSTGACHLHKWSCKRQHPTLARVLVSATHTSGAASVHTLAHHSHALVANRSQPSSGPWPIGWGSLDLHHQIILLFQSKNQY